MIADIYQYGLNDNNQCQKGSLTDDYFYTGTAMQLSSRSYKQGGGDDDDDDWRRTIKQDYFYGSGGLTSFTGERDTYYAYTDYQGSMTAYVDRHSLEDDYLYDAFGTPVRGRFNGDNALGYNGKVFDTITGLYDYGFRDYSPAYGNFTTVDPVRDSVNWYAYVGMNPVNRVDYLGLLGVDDNVDDYILGQTLDEVIEDAVLYYGAKVIESEIEAFIEENPDTFDEFNQALIDFNEGLEKFNRQFDQNGTNGFNLEDPNEDQSRNYVEKLKKKNQ